MTTKSESTGYRIDAKAIRGSVGDSAVLRLPDPVIGESVRPLHELFAFVRAMSN
jgi:hypothetical protein